MMDWLPLLALIGLVAAVFLVVILTPSREGYPELRGFRSDLKPAREFYTEPPSEWRSPHADIRQCWGCGLKPTVRVRDMHYGRDEQRRYCDTCWALVEPLMRRLIRPPIGNGGFRQPIIVTR